jgi:pimeloyl-ACP methyl ester carboxylesterase
LDYLKSRREVDPKRIGFVGHSEGGMIAPMIAARRPDVGFMILLAAPGITGEELALAQAETFSRLKGFSQEGIQRCRPLNRDAIRMLRSNLSPDQKKATLQEMEQKMIPLMSKEDRQLYDQLKAQREANAEIGMAMIGSPWMQFLLGYDPAPDFKRVKCPVLALNGQLDTQVLAAQNLPALEKHLRAGGNTRVAVKELKGLNHLFQTAQTGDLKEYGTIEETFAPAALAEILNWLKATATPSSTTHRPNAGLSDRPPGSPLHAP